MLPKSELARYVACDRRWGDSNPCSLNYFCLFSSFFIYWLSNSIIFCFDNPYDNFHLCLRITTRKGYSVFLSLKFNSKSFGFLKRCFEYSDYFSKVRNFWWRIKISARYEKFRVIWKGGAVTGYICWHLAAEKSERLLTMAKKILPWRTVGGLKENS